jgi:two-component system copper resistance phosphate regulon response regulator CusR
MADFLIIEDDPKIASAVRDGLIAEGHSAVAVFDGDDGLAECKAHSFDAVVLDWMLPKVSGLEVLKSLRQSGHRTPILLLTARDTVEDRVQGLDAGADDYLVKPFAFAELLARLRALVRRSTDADASQKCVGDLTLDLVLRRAQRGTRIIPLTPREFDLLSYFARHYNQTITRAMLARDVWHEVQRATPLDNVIDVHIAHLRRKIDDGFDAKLIHTVRGVGFVFGEPRHE